jgi:hypothetical protein
MTAGKETMYFSNIPSFLPAARLKRQARALKSARRKSLF